MAGDLVLVLGVEARKPLCCLLDGLGRGRDGRARGDVDEMRHTSQVRMSAVCTTINTMKPKNTTNKAYAKTSWHFG